MLHKLLDRKRKWHVDVLGDKRNRLAISRCFKDTKSLRFSRTFPQPGASVPAASRKSVVLPAPFRPTTAMHSFEKTRALSSSTTFPFAVGEADV